MTSLEAILGRFRLPGTFLGPAACGSGHIHVTRAAAFREADGTVRRYVLQRINRHVFQDLEGLMANLGRVTAHLVAHLSEEGGDTRGALELLPTRDGATHWTDPEGEAWRVFRFIEGARSLERPESLAQVGSAGRAIGRFQRLLADLPAESLVETIPRFHDTPWRLQVLREAEATDRSGRAAACVEERAFASARAPKVSRIVEGMASGEIPTRVVHNDTKFSNLLFDEATDEALCLIDLDTVMPGCALFDFGDAVRSFCGTGAEDEAGTALDLEAFRALAEGYLGEAGGFLSTAETGLLAHAAWLITLECGVRFLTDHLDGDHYFTLQRPGQNLERARAQFRLAEDMERRMGEMERAVALSPGARCSPSRRK